MIMDDAENKVVGSTLLLNPPEFALQTICNHMINKIKSYH